MDIDDVLAGVTAAHQTASICLDGTIAARLEDAQARRIAALGYDLEHNEPATAPAVEREIAGLAVEAEKATVGFVVQSIGASAWRRLMADHPPSDADTLEGWSVDPVHFPPAALAASCVDPVMTEAQAVELAERLSEGQWRKIYSAVFAVNVGDDIPKFGAGTGAHPPSEPSSTTAAPEESLTASSSANETSET